MVIDLNCGRPAEGGSLAHGHSFYADVNQLPFGISNRIYKTSKLVMRRIPVSPDLKWVMGQSGVANATPHYVTLTNSFYIGVYEMTYGQWENISHGFPSGALKYAHTNFTDISSMPVSGVMFTEVRGSDEGLGWFSDKDAVTRRDVDANTPIDNLRLRTGILFDLPTEAQWEYACRAGESSLFNNGEDSIGETAWHKENSFVTTVRGDSIRAFREVGTRYAPNNWGLYDMHGNVREMCLDVWRNDLGTDEVKEPLGAPHTGDSNKDKYRVFRGGSFSDSAENCRSSYRTYTNVKAHYVYNGLRVVCPYPLGLNW
jgi:formylglycine-generating enzyme required for sulfatase activity